MKEKLANQLALDYNCTPEEVLGSKNIISLRESLLGRRIFRSDDSFIKICSVGGKLIISCEEPIYEWCQNTYQDMDAAWFSLFPNLKKLDDTIRTFGHTITDCHHYYLPERKVEVRLPGLTASEEKPTLVWYEKEDLEQFRGDKRFLNALSFISESPDMLAVTAVENGEILGMAGASADSDLFWQIGIDVTNAGRGRGIGTYLTILLREEILRRDKVPFYGTAETHIKSQRVGVQAGFVPAWAEIYTKEIH